MRKNFFFKFYSILTFYNYGYINNASLINWKIVLYIYIYTFKKKITKANVDHLIFGYNIGWFDINRILWIIASYIDSDDKRIVTVIDDVGKREWERWRKNWVRNKEDRERKDRETNRWEIPFRIISAWPGFVWTRTNRFHWLPRPLFRLADP